MILKD